MWERGGRAGDHCVRGVRHHPVLMGYPMGLDLRLKGLEEDVHGGHSGTCLGVACVGALQ